MSDLVVHAWSEDLWLQSREEWNALLCATDADPLFLSWDWQTLWWRYFGGGASLRILAAYRGSQLVGIAPFYLCSEVRQRLFRVRSLQLLGFRWRDPTRLISEYLDVIAPPTERAEVVEAILHTLAEENDWTECVIGMALCGAGWAKQMEDLAKVRGAYRRETDRSTAWQADLSQGFEIYLRSLRGSARRSLWNQRRRLEQHGAVKLDTIGAADVPAALDDLNRLHALRWKGPAFSGARLQFHLTLAQRLAARNQLRLSRLMVGGRLVSMLYDLKVGDRQYNIQMGFDADFDRSASLGLLHLGYALEAAHADGVMLYDFLAGTGRSADYKRAISQHARELSCVQLSTGRVLTRLYRWHDSRKQRTA